MAVSEYIEATLVETEVVEVNFVEEDVISVNFTTIDTIQDRGYIVETVKGCFVFSENPTAIDTKRFRALNAYVDGSLQVLLNGIKEKYITVHSSTEFSFLIDTVPTDDIEISYIKA